MSWLIPHWGKERKYSGLMYIVFTFIFIILFFSPIITYITMHYVFLYSIGESVTYTAIVIMTLVGIISLVMMSEFIKFIKKIREVLYILSTKDRINKENLYIILDEFDEGWRDRRGE